MAIGPDRIQVLKQESAGLGGDGADDVPYTTPIEPQEDAIEAAGIYLQDATNRDEAVFLEQAGANLRFVDVSNPSGFSLSQLATGGAGITEGQHTTLDTLIHEIAENCDVEVIRSGGRVDSVIVWTNSGHTVKIRETILTRSSGQVATITTKQYDGAGALKNTLTKTITRSSGQVATIAGVLT